MEACKNFAPFKDNQLFKNLAVHKYFRKRTTPGNVTHCKMSPCKCNDLQKCRLAKMSPREKLMPWKNAPLCKSGAHAKVNLVKRVAVQK